MRLFFILVAMAISDSSLNLTVQSLSQQISTKGARAVVHSLTANGEKSWDSVLKKIKTGEEPWLDLAIKLKPGTDAGASEDLFIAFSRALVNNPEGVLRRMGKPFTFEDTCTIPFIEPDEKTVSHFVKEAETALGKIKTGPLAKQAARCLKNIQDIGKRASFQSKENEKLFVPKQSEALRPISTKVESGDAKAIRTAVELLKSEDVTALESVAVALTKAATKNPETVLLELSKRFPGEGVCAFLVVDESNEKEIREALSRVKSGPAATLAKKCRKLLSSPVE